MQTSKTRLNFEKRTFFETIFLLKHNHALLIIVSQEKED